MGELFFHLASSEEHENKKEQNMFLNLTDNANVCVVAFGATWCGPCKMLASKLETLVSNNNSLSNCVLTPHNENKMPLKKSVVFVKVDVDAHEDLAETYKVNGIPHIVFFKNGELQQDVIVGCQPEKVISKVNELA